MNDLTNNMNGLSSVLLRIRAWNIENALLITDRQSANQPEQGQMFVRLYISQCPVLTSSKCWPPSCSSLLPSWLSVSTWSRLTTGPMWSRISLPNCRRATSAAPRDQSRVRPGTGVAGGRISLKYQGWTEVSTATGRSWSGSTRTNGGFNTGTGIYTTPERGVYQCCASFRCRQGGVCDFSILRNDVRFGCKISSLFSYKLLITVFFSWKLLEPEEQDIPDTNGE